MTTIFWTARAQADLAAIDAFVRLDSPHFAEMIVRRVLHAVDRLQDFPRSGRAVPEYGDPQIREVILTPYRIIYRILDAETIHILTVHHAELLNSRGDMELIVETSTLTQTTSGSVIGSIWLQSNQNPRIDFPEAGWTDFPVVILGWWLTQIKDMLREESTQADCSFMDGPFEFRINTSGEIQLRRRRASGNTEIAKGQISLEAFWKQLNIAVV